MSVQKLKVGELCAGYGGLGMAVEEVFGAELAWVSEFDDAPSKILAHHWPNVPNYGDMTKIDWAAIEPVDIISGGTPCQDLSHAGRRAGMTGGTRSNLWVQMREAIAIIKPTYVVWENVRGAYSAEANSDLEPCPGCMGDTPDRGAVLRALGRVLGDLSDLGYDCQWRGLRAADVGAPHGRFRVFVLATKNADITVSSERRIPAPGQAETGWARTDAGGRNRTPAADAHSGERDGRECYEVGGQEARALAARGGDVLTAHTPGARCSEGQDSRAGGSNESQGSRRGEPQRTGGERTSTNCDPLEPTTRAALPGHSTADPRGELNADSSETGPREELPRLRNAINQEALRKTSGGSDSVPKQGDMWESVREHQGNRGQVSPPVAGEAIPERLMREVRDDEQPARSPQRSELGKRRPAQPADTLRKLPSEASLAGRPGTEIAGKSMVAWGPYEAAIRRWERVIGRAAPAPTEPTGRNGTHRLSAHFTEWLMGVPDGWIVDVPGISRNEALKAAGNGVVPQQAAAALRDMLAHTNERSGA